jgi:Family of unknown function (DUF5317)
MVLALAVLLGVAVGLLLGGHLGQLADLQLRGVPLFALAIGCQLVIFPTGILPWSLPDALVTALSLATYAILTVVAILNRRVRGFPIAGLGMACNLIAIVANGGHMPALPEAMRAAGLDYTGVHNNSVASASPHVSWLVDRWGAPGWLPLANVYSVGDVLLAVGVVLILSAAMGARVPRLRVPRSGVPQA